MKKPLKKLDLTKIKKAGWTYANRRLAQTFIFKNFDDAFAFMTRCALEVAKLDHHPEWFNVYNKVYIELTTHSAGDVTKKDFELALIIDKIASSFAKKAD